MILVVAEKPSVASTIAAVLGANAKTKNGYENDKYTVSWCVGHLVGLASPDLYGERFAEKPWSFKNLPIIPSEWRFTINSATKSQFEILKFLMNRDDVNEIVCATDAGREGECIFRYVYNKAKCNKPVKRLWTSSLEEKAIEEGFSALKDDSEYDNLYSAGLARAKADWLVGMNATRLFTVKYSTLLSIGRVQTPTLAMIVERNNKVVNFIKEKFYTVDIDCGAFKAQSERFDDNSVALDIQTKINNSTVTVKSVKREIKTVNPPKLYDLTTLQREANRIYGYTAQQTLDYTQSLYEKKLCTYPRTDSQYITDDMEQTALSAIENIDRAFPDFEVDISEPNVKRCINNAKVSDHHALLPTAEICNYNLLTLPQTEFNILSMIALRLLAAVSKQHKYETVSVELISDCDNYHIFKATGKKIIFNGWKDTEPFLQAKADTETKTLPELYKGETFQNVSSIISEHFTSPPKQFTEDTLLSAMETAGNENYDESSDVEKKGLGTPATRAGIIENLVSRGYILREKKKLLPTTKGNKLIECVPNDVKSAKMTADWETQLQSIENGTKSDFEFLNSITAYVNSLVEKYAVADNSNTFKGEYEYVGICPKCGKKVNVYPKSYSCESGKNGCGFVVWRNIAGKNISVAQVKKLLEKGKTDLIKGFKNKSGKSYDAFLRLNLENKVEFEFPSRSKTSK